METNTEVRLSVLEHTVIKQNESVDGRLISIERALNELHNKMDSHILNQAVTVTKLEGHVTSLQKEVTNVNNKIAKTASTVSMFVAAAITGVFEYLKR